MFVVYPPIMQHPAFGGPRCRMMQAQKSSCCRSSNSNTKNWSGCNWRTIVEGASEPAKTDQSVLFQGRNILATENKDTIGLQLDLPGVKLADVQVSLHQDLLTVAAARTSGKHFTISKNFAVDPLTTDLANITATLSHGVLSIEIPKTGSPDIANVPIIAALPSDEQTENDLKLTADLPGVKADDVRVTFDGRRIILQARRLHGQVESISKRFYLLPYGKYVTSELKAHLSDGVLTITAPSRDNAETTKVVQVTDGSIVQKTDRETVDTSKTESTKDEISVETVDEDFESEEKEHNSMEEKEWEHIAEGDKN